MSHEGHRTPWRHGRGVERGRQCPGMHGHGRLAPGVARGAAEDRSGLARVLAGQCHELAAGGLPSRPGRCAVGRSLGLHPSHPGRLAGAPIARHAFGRTQGGRLEVSLPVIPLCQPSAPEGFRALRCCRALKGEGGDDLEDRPLRAAQEAVPVDLHGQGALGDPQWEGGEWGGRETIEEPKYRGISPSTWC